MRDCDSCGKSIFDNEVCICTKSTEFNDTTFDPMKEVLIIHNKVDKIESELKVMQKSIESLARASLSHSEALLGILKVTDMLKNAISLLDNKNNDKK